MTDRSSRNNRVSTPLKQSEWIARYRQRLIDVAGVSEEISDEIAKAATFEEISAHYESDPEGAADMEMSYWEE